jgi:hypothetical protein
MSHRRFRLSGLQCTVGHLLLVTGFAAVGLGNWMLFRNSLASASAWLINKVVRPELLLILFLAAVHNIAKR